MVIAGALGLLARLEGNWGYVRCLMRFWRLRLLGRAILPMPIRPAGAAKPLAGGREKILLHWLVVEDSGGRRHGFRRGCRVQHA